MKSTGIVRDIDKVGRIVIPKEIRNSFKIDEGDPLEIFVDGDKIVLAKYTPSCMFCGSSEKLADYEGHRICRKCLDALRKI